MITLHKAVIEQTVLLEAEGEPLEGKLAVAFVILNRMRDRQQNAYQVCWAPWQFSCWQDHFDKICNRFTRASAQSLMEVQIAVDQATGGKHLDPTKGATHYLNEKLTREQRGDGSLPDWVSKLEQTAVIGQHTFYKEKQ